jgi:chlorite dismutase
MADLDFGFTAVDQDELVTKTGEAAAIQESIAEDLKKVAETSVASASSKQIEELDSKVDILVKVVANAVDELDAAKMGLGSSTDVAVSHLKSSLAEVEELILPLLYKLMENEDKEYIYWPNRKVIINQQIDRVKKVTRG